MKGGHEFAAVGVVVSATGAFCGSATKIRRWVFGVIAWFVGMGKCFLDTPAETARAVFVDGFGNEKEGANFEDGGADEGGYPAAVKFFVVEFGVWADEREPGEEAVYHPDYATDREDYGHVVGYVPNGELRHHSE